MFNFFKSKTQVFVKINDKWRLVNISSREIDRQDIKIGDRVYFGEGVYLNKGITIGNDSFFDGNTVVGESCSFGNGCAIWNRVKIGNCCRFAAGVLVFQDVFIGDACSFGQLVRLGIGSKIDNYVMIERESYIEVGVKIGESSLLASGCYIGMYSKLGKDVRINHLSWIGKKANIKDKANPVTVSILGSRYPLHFWGEDKIVIGCTQLKINEWLSDLGKQKAKEINMVEQEIKEYKEYIILCRKIFERGNYGRGYSAV
jgi:UDP-3-O-[3-hydroxymyristoyl] glucosamine N-acyltransferase